MKERTKKPAKKTTQPPGWLADPDVIVFAADREIPVGGAVQHSLSDWAGGLFGRTKQDVRQDWDKVVNQMQFLLEGVAAATKEYQLNELTFQLGFSAEGQVVFVAKAGVTTSITAKFVRKPATPAV
jgi:hypothetical protein